MRALQAEQRPRSASQLKTGMFSYQRMAWPQCGQRERGTTRLYFSSSFGGWPWKSAHSAAHCRSSILGKR